MGNFIVPDLHVRNYHVPMVPTITLSLAIEHGVLSYQKTRLRIISSNSVLLPGLSLHNIRLAIYGSFFFCDEFGLRICPKHPLTSEASHS